MATSPSSAGGKSVLTGTKNNDSLTADEGASFILAGNGDDLVTGLRARDHLYGGAGSDTINGGAGGDDVKGGSGDDTVDGGAGSDRVEGGSGNDVAVYVVAENLRSFDRYDGGAGADTLRLVLTRDEWMRADVQADVARYLEFLAASTNAGGQATGQSFTFTAFGLEVTKFEKLQVRVDGQELDPRDEPVAAADDAATMGEDGPSVSGNVLGNDLVPDLVRSVELVTGPAIGTLAFNADGSYTYSAGSHFDSLALGETATQSFVYRVTDVDGDADEATVTITITGANDGPVLAVVSDTGSVVEDAVQTVSGQLTASDVDQGAVLTWSVVGGGTGTYGTLEVDPAGQWTYTLANASTQVQALAQGETATETFVVLVADEHAALASATVSVTVTGADEPVMLAATDDGPIAGTEDTPVVISSSAVTANDTSSSGTLILDAVGAAEHGTVALVGDNIVFTPEGNYYGPARFTYAVRDGSGHQATASVTLSIEPVNDAPVLVAPPGNVTAATTKPFAYSLPAATFADVDGEQLTYGAATPSGALPAWLAFDPQTLTFSGTPGASDVGLVSVTLTVTDPSGAQASAVLPITVLDGTTISGTTGNDVLYGTVNGELIRGLDGWNMIYARPGSDVIEGGGGPDWLYGEAGDDVLIGGDGNDRLYGGMGNDVVDGGAGNDFIDDEGGSDRVSGGDGDDVIRVWTGTDTVDAGAGNDSIGIDAIYGGDAHIITTGPGSDRLTIARFTAHPVVVTDFTPGAGGDVLDIQGALRALIYHWDGQSNLFESGHVRLMQSGSDVLLQTDQYGPIDGAQWSTVVRLQDLDGNLLTGDNFYPNYDPHGGIPDGLVLNGTELRDVLYGGAGDDTIYGNGGNDSITAGAGADTVYGGEGDDRLSGDEGDDTLYGGPGDDYLDGHQGDNVLIGGEGNDTAIVPFNAQYPSNNTVDLGDGDDMVHVSTATSSFSTITLGGGKDTVAIRPGGPVVVTDFTTGAGGDVIDYSAALKYELGPYYDGNANPFGTAGFLRLAQSGVDTLLQVDRNGGGDAFVTVLTLQNTTVADFVFGNFFPAFNPTGGPTPGVTYVGTSGNDVFAGTAGDDAIDGLDGGDVLRGNAGNDVISGGSGNDSLYGDGGDDLVYGGIGNDAIEGGSGNDTLDGGDGDDTFNGEFGDDLLIGGNGNDVFYVNVPGWYYKGSDTVDAGAGNDHIHVAGKFNVEHNAITTGTGSDIIYLENYLGASSVNALIVTDFSAGAGGDVLNLDSLLRQGLAGWDGVSNPLAAGYMRLLQNGSHTLVQFDVDGPSGGENYQTEVVLQGVSSGALTAQNLFPLYQPDGSGIYGTTLSGTSGSDLLTGTVGDDVMSGSDGNDALRGGNGNDSLDGGAGDDMLAGGPGRDTLTGGTGADTFKFAPHASTDTITDFTPAINGDKLDIKDVLVSYDPATSGIASFVQLSESGGSTTISVDAHGGADFIPLAVLQGQTALLLNDLLAYGNLVVS